MINSYVSFVVPDIDKSNPSEANIGAIVKTFPLLHLTVPALLGVLDTTLCDKVCQ
jgi:hypothetical protein